MKDCRSKKKIAKENSLLSAAFKLFLIKGYENTAIDEIVKQAGVAKGTFYLYFKSKYDIVNKLILSKSSSVIKEAIDELSKRDITNLDDELIFILDYMIVFFKNNPLLLKFLNKNVSWGLYKKVSKSRASYYEIDFILDQILQKMIQRGMDKGAAETTLYLIFELVGSVCYNSIVLEEPKSIDSIKPILFVQIRKMLH